MLIKHINGLTIDPYDIKKEDINYNMTFYKNAYLPTPFPLLFINDSEVQTYEFIFKNKKNLQIFWYYAKPEMIIRFIEENKSNLKKILYNLDYNKWLRFDSETEDINHPFRIKLNLIDTINNELKNKLNEIKTIEQINYLKKINDDIYKLWFKESSQEEQQKYIEHLIKPFIENKFNQSIPIVNESRIDLKKITNRFELPFHLEKEMIYFKPLDTITQILPTWSPSNEIKQLDFFLNSIEYLKRDPLDFFDKYPKDIILKIKEMTDSIKLLTNESIESISKDEIAKYLQLNKDFMNSCSNIEFNF